MTRAMRVREMTGIEQIERWVYAGHSAESHPFMIGKVNVRKRPWRRREEPPVPVKDPLYGQDLLFPICLIEAGSPAVRFAVGEFSNGVWGFFVPEGS